MKPRINVVSSDAPSATNRTAAAIAAMRTRPSAPES
jgi:hypothetical protein